MRPRVGMPCVGSPSRSICHSYSAVIASPVLAGAATIGILMVLVPLAQIDTPARGGVVTALPVVVGFAMALYPLWSGSDFGLATSVVLTVLASSLVLLPWDRIPRYLHAVSPIADLVLVTLVNPAAGDPAHALLEALLLIAFGILVRRVVIQLEQNRAAARAA